MLETTRTKDLRNFTESALYVCVSCGWKEKGTNVTISTTLVAHRGRKGGGQKRWRVEGIRINT